MTSYPYSFTGVHAGNVPTHLNVVNKANAYVPDPATQFTHAHHRARFLVRAQRLAGTEPFVPLRL